MTRWSQIDLSRFRPFENVFGDQLGLESNFALQSVLIDQRLDQVVTQDDVELLSVLVRCDEFALAGFRASFDVLHFAELVELHGDDRTDADMLSHDVSNHDTFRFFTDVSVTEDNSFLTHLLLVSLLRLKVQICFILRTTTCTTLDKQC